METKEKKKTTARLESELRHARRLEDFMKENEEELYLQSVPELLNEMLICYNMQKNDVIERAAFPGTYAYKIFSGKKNGSREKLLWLAFGFPLTLEETRQLLRAGGYSELSPKNKRDALVIYALDSGYTIQEVNKLLLENEEDVFA